MLLQINGWNWTKCYTIHYFYFPKSFSGRAWFCWCIRFTISRRIGFCKSWIVFSCASSGHRIWLPLSNLIHVSLPFSLACLVILPQQTWEQLPILVTDLFLIKTRTLLDGWWVTVSQHALLPACYCQSNRRERPLIMGEFQSISLHSNFLCCLPCPFYQPPYLGYEKWFRAAWRSASFCDVFLLILITQIMDGWIPKCFRLPLVKFQSVQM